MAQMNYIRHEVNQKGDSYATVALRMGIDPRTVSKYDNLEEFKVKPKQKRKARVMDPVKPIIDKWIKEVLKKGNIKEQPQKCMNNYVTFKLI